MRRPRVLLVDDSAQNRVLLRAFLESEGIEVFEAASGREALEKTETQSFDLIILDLMMPGMDGHEVLVALKRSDSTKDIPVLVMSALGEEEARVRAIENGAADFLTRPASRAETMVRVRGLIRQRILQERLDDSFFKLTSLVRTTESQLADLTEKGSLEMDPLPALVEHIRQAGKAGRIPQFVIAMDSKSQEARLFLASGEVRIVPIGIEPSFYEIGHNLTGVWNAQEPVVDRWVRIFEGILYTVSGTVSNLAYCVGPGIALAAVNYPGGADALDAEVLRGFALHWQFVSRVATSAREIEEAFEYTIAALARAAEAYDEDVAFHLRRVNEYSRELAAFIGMPSAFVRSIGIQAQMHDVGKIHVPLEILQKPGELTAEEDRILASHTTEGARILGDHPRLKMAANIALTHHENWDGSGYPQGLRGEAIPIEGRIAKLADVYDALRSERAYKPAIAHKEVMEIIMNGGGRISPHHFDPGLLDAFTRISRRFNDIYEFMTR